NLSPSYPSSLCYKLKCSYAAASCHSASIVEESFEYLDAPVERIAGADIPMPYAANLERLAVPQIEDIVRAAKRTCYRSVP
ncbi:Pyruvate dehydrogenase E1 component subunit beta-1, mitochondrial-like protein, partial [Drosera capensis]